MARGHTLIWCEGGVALDLRHINAISISERSLVVVSNSSFAKTSEPSTRSPLTLVAGSGGKHSVRSAAHPSILAATAHQRDEHCFLEWLADLSRPDQVQLMGQSVYLPLNTLLKLVCASRQELPDLAAATLERPTGTTIGAAAIKLMFAGSDPTEPRCRSYRAAV